MLFRTEFDLIAPAECVPGSLVFIPGVKGGGDYALVMQPPKDSCLNAFRLADLSHRFFNSFAVQPFLQLGQAEVRLDLASSLPANDFYPAGAFLIAPGTEGIYLPSRHLEGQGSVIKLTGDLVDHEQGPREVGFSRYDLGFLRHDRFITVQRVELERQQAETL